MTLISVDELARRLGPNPSGDGDVVVCDVRFHLTDHDRGRREYDAGHLPGAVFVDLHTRLAGGPGGGRHPLPDVGRFARTIAELGIGPDDEVVAYDDAGGATASRLWWMLRSIGHRRVAVLDGGLAAWTAAGHPLTTDVTHREPVAPRPVTGWTGIVDADTVARAVTEGVAVVDARAPERFRGEHEPIDPRAGHVPGAVNRFHAEQLGTDGRHRSRDELVARFAGLGDAPIVYCGSGVTACHVLLAMAVAGIDEARLYPGSWSEWSNDPDRPAAVGD